MKSTTVMILQEARRLIEFGFSSTRQAKDLLGNRISPTDYRAAYFSEYGALIRAVYDTGHSGREVNPICAIVMSANGITKRGILDYKGVYQSTQQDALQLFDTAIAFAEKYPALDWSIFHASRERADMLPRPRPLAEGRFGVAGISSVPRYR